MNQRQRLRIVFGRGEAIKYISHLDLARAWERVLRRAGVPLAYSQGFNPRPKIVFASALPVGVIARREMMDLFLKRPVMPLNLNRRLKPHLPPGLSVVSAKEVYHHLPSLPSQVCGAQYRVEIEWAESREALASRTADFMAAASLVRERRGKTYDLRPLVESLSVAEAMPDGFALHMRLSLRQNGTARHDEVLDALGLTEMTRLVCREGLFFRNRSGRCSKKPRVGPGLGD